MRQWNLDPSRLVRIVVEDDSQNSIIATDTVEKLWKTAGTYKHIGEHKEYSRSVISAWAALMRENDAKVCAHMASQIKDFHESNYQRLVARAPRGASIDLRATLRFEAGVHQKLARVFDGLSWEDFMTPVDAL